MGKFNEIQEETKQSFGRNSFTTRIANDAVEFDSAADQFKFLDPIDAPAITINGEPVAPGEQTQADWNQSDSSKVDYIKNKPVDNKGNYNLGGANNNFGTNSSSNVTIGAPTAPEVANTMNGENLLETGLELLEIENELAQIYSYFNDETVETILQIMKENRALSLRELEDLGFITSKVKEIRKYAKNKNK